MTGKRLKITAWVVGFPLAYAILAYAGCRLDAWMITLYDAWGWL